MQGSPSSTCGSDKLPPSGLNSSVQNVMGSTNIGPSERKKCTKFLVFLHAVCLPFGYSRRGHYLIDEAQAIGHWICIQDKPQYPNYLKVTLFSAELVKKNSWHDRWEVGPPYTNSEMRVSPSNYVMLKAAYKWLTQRIEPQQPGQWDIP